MSTAHATPAPAPLSERERFERSHAGPNARYFEAWADLLQALDYVRTAGRRVLELDAAGFAPPGQDPAFDGPAAWEALQGDAGGLLWLAEVFDSVVQAEAPREVDDVLRVNGFLEKYQ